MERLKNTLIIQSINTKKRIMKPRHIILLLIVLINIFSFQLLAQNTVIKAGHFFDARSGKMLDNQMIIIKDGKIKEAGANLKIRYRRLSRNIS